MDTFMEIFEDERFIIGLTGLCVLLFILYVINFIKLIKIRKEYKKFMNILGDGTNIQDILDKHIEKINKTISKNEELEKFCIKLDTDMSHCIQKMRNIQIQCI